MRKWQSKDYQRDPVEASVGTATPVDPKLFEEPEEGAGEEGEGQEGDGDGLAVEDAIASEQFVSDEALAKGMLCEEYFATTSSVTEEWMDECEVGGWLGCGLCRASGCV